MLRTGLPSELEAGLLFDLQMMGCFVFAFLSRAGGLTNRKDHLPRFAGGTGMWQLRQDWGYGQEEGDGVSLAAVGFCSLRAWLHLFIVRAALQCKGESMFSWHKSDWQSGVSRKGWDGTGEQ